MLQWNLSQRRPSLCYALTCARGDLEENTGLLLIRGDRNRRPLPCYAHATTKLTPRVLANYKQFLNLPNKSLGDHQSVSQSHCGKG